MGTREGCEWRDDGADKCFVVSAALALTRIENKGAIEYEDEFDTHEEAAGIAAAHDRGAETYEEAEEDRRGSFGGGREE